MNFIKACISGNTICYLLIKLYIDRSFKLRNVKHSRILYNNYYYVTISASVSVLPLAVSSDASILPKASCLDSFPSMFICLIYHFEVAKC